MNVEPIGNSVTIESKNYDSITLEEATDQIQDYESIYQP